jgi:excisionase family DNA binding protein
MASRQHKTASRNSSQPNVSFQPRCLGVVAAAHYLGATVWAMRVLAWEKRVPHVRIGSRILFDRTDLDRYIESQKTEAFA